jgi:hypothetical protein
VVLVRSVVHPARMVLRQVLRGWLVVASSLLLATGCGDDADAPEGPLDAGRPLDGAVSTPDAGVITLPDGAVVLDDAQVATPPMQPQDGACAPAEQLLPVTAPAYHRTGTIAYTDLPPVGGDHNGCWGKWGVWEADAPLPAERWVHNLEHGGVVVLYRCPEGCAREVAEMTRFVQGRQQALLTPYAALPTRFAVVSWGARVTSDCFDTGVLERFYRAHVAQGPESISSDPPTSCL